MITVHNLTKRFGGTVVLDDVSLSITRGETVALFGASGSGKTTLLRCLAGLETFEAGKIMFGDIALEAGQGKSERGKALRHLRQMCGVVFQQYNLFPHLTVLENVILAPLKVLKLPRKQAVDEAMTLLERLGLKEQAGQRPAQCSGGEQQRTAIARALAMKPDCLLYDEPTSALDRNRAESIWALMIELAAQGQTQVIVTHQHELIEAVPCRTIHMQNGKVLETTDQYAISSK